MTYLIPALAFLLPLLLYLLTLAPTYVATDSAEFALCIHYWGVCHPPGFPLYTTLGHFFVNIWPWGSLIYKVNLLSALFGASTILFVFLTLVKLKVGRLPAFFTALMLAVSGPFWQLSVIADIFTFGAFLFALSLFLLFSGRKLSAVFVLGLSASHLYLTAFVMPVFLVYGWPPKGWVKMGQIGRIYSAMRSSSADGGLRALGLIRRIRLTGPIYVLAGVVFGLGLLPQLVMYWRMLGNPLVNWGHVSNFSEFISFVARREFGSFFLLATPNNMPNIGNFVFQTGLLFWQLIRGLGFIVPTVFVVLLFFGKLYRRPGFTFLLVVFGIISLLQTASLAAVAPRETTFELTKFYVLPLTIFALLVGVALDFLLGKLGRYGKSGGLVLALMIGAGLLFGGKANNYSKNYFSQEYVVDALSRLSPDAVIITPEHSLNFAARYEQEVNGRFGDIKIINISKRDDNPKYQPELFAGEVDREFYEVVRNGRELGPFETYTLEAIARNLDRDIYLNQGEFENVLWAYLKPYIRPYGLWWKVEKEGLEGIEGLEGTEGVREVKGYKRVQRQIAGNYAASWESAAQAYIEAGQYEKALEYLKAAAGITGKQSQKLDFVKKVLALASKSEEPVANGDINSLNELGVAYFSLGDFTNSRDVYLKLLEADPSNAFWLSNAGASYASLGEREKAWEYFQKALVINPDLELAKQGLRQLER